MFWKTVLCSSLWWSWALQGPASILSSSPQMLAKPRDRIKGGNNACWSATALRLPSQPQKMAPFLAPQPEAALPHPLWSLDPGCSSNQSVRLTSNITSKLSRSVQGAFETAWLRISTVFADLKKLLNMSYPFWHQDFIFFCFEEPYGNLL